MLRIAQKGCAKIIVLTALCIIAACGGGGGGGSGSSSTITVKGTVVDGTSAPVSAAIILLNHDTATLVITGPDGAFSFANVTPPYTLTIKSGTTINEYRNLSRANPMVSTAFGGGALYSATLGGKVTDAQYPLSAGQKILLGSTVDAPALIRTTASAQTGTYSAPFKWTGGPATKTNLAALQCMFSGDLITSYIKTGTLNGVSITSGVNRTGLDIALSTAVTTSSTTLIYSSGAYINGSSGKYNLLKANGAQFHYDGVIPSGTSVLVPSGGAIFWIKGRDASGNEALRIGSAVLDGTTTLDLPASTVLKNNLPSAGATNVSKPVMLSWTSVSGADMYLVTFSGPGFRYAFYLPGSSSTLTIPDYSTLGLPLAANAIYSWNVLAGKSSGLSTDALADPASGGIELVMLQSSNMESYSSVSTTFRTAP